MTDSRGWSRRKLVQVAAAGIAVAGLGAVVRGVVAQTGTTVSIADFAYQPAALLVAAGETVTWSNDGASPHTVTAADGSFDSGLLMPGASFSHTFAAGGAVPYQCTFHPLMTATVTVAGV